MEEIDDKSALGSVAEADAAAEPVPVRQAARIP
jgi:hypothetical protein